MTSQELQEYQANFLKHHPAPKVERLVTPEQYINVPDTSDRQPYGGISWINYWRAMSGVHANDLVCSHCGAAIKAELAEGDPADMQAHGAHVMHFNTGIIMHPDTEPLFKTYITPLCPACNNPAVVDPLTLRQASLLVEEIDPTTGNK